MMSLYKRGNVHWSRIMHRGVLYQESMGVKTLTEARAKEADFRMRIINSDPSIQPQMTVRTFTANFLAYLNSRVKIKALRPNTYKMYANSWKRLLDFPDFASAALCEIDGRLIERFVHKCIEDDYEIATINLYLRGLSVGLNLAKAWRHISETPKIQYLPNENRRSFVIWPTDEALLVRTTIYPTLRDIIPFAIDTGLRREEICRLRFEDYDGQTIFVREGKTKNSIRRVPLTTRANAIVERRAREAREGVPFLFTIQNGREQVYPDWISQKFLEARREAALAEDCVFHCTRHTFCTKLGKNGASAFEIMKLAGHSDIKTSARYVHPDDEQLSKAIDRLN